MTAFDESFNTLLASVVADCNEIGSYMQNSEFVVRDEYGDLPSYGVYNTSRPLVYLKKWHHTRTWDKYFSHVMDLWDQDHMSAMRFNALIERLSAPAARLDLLVPKLEQKCQSLPNMPDSIVRNARQIHTCINSFLNSADDGLYYWKKKANFFNEDEIRQRRPIMKPHTAIDDSQSMVDNQSTEEKSGDAMSDHTILRARLKSLSNTFTSNSALLTLIGIVSVIACIIQTQAFFVSTHRRRSNSSLKGTVDDPDFYNAIQTFLMQVAGLYMVLAPALRPASGDPRYGFWAGFMSFLSLGSGVASLAVYPFFATLSPLLACISNVLQTFVALQLVFSVNDGGPNTRGIGDKKEV